MKWLVLVLVPSALKHKARLEGLNLISGKCCQQLSDIVEIIAYSRVVGWRWWKSKTQLLKYKVIYLKCAPITYINMLEKVS